MDLYSALQAYAATHRVSLAEHYTEDSQLLYVIGDQVLTLEQAERLVA